MVSVNGSSITGRCSSVANSGGTLNCTDPASSVLFDGHIPTLIGLEGDMWASQLLTLLPTAATTEITFDFHNTPDTTVSVEMVMVNCPQWGIGVDSIVIRENMVNIGSIHTEITSCDYLVRTCVTASLTSPTVSLRFALSLTSYWVHLGQIIFHTDTSGCFPDTTITDTTPQTSTTSSPRETTTATETQTTSNSLATTAATPLPITLQTETTPSSECVPVINGVISHYHFTK